MTDKVLVIGAGTAGIQAALDLADAGVDVVLVDKKAVIGGALAAQLNEDAVGEESLEGDVLPRTSQVKTNEKIEVLTLAEVTELKGMTGHFTATIRQKARFVNDNCIRCNKCRDVCPVVRPNEFDHGLSYRKAIYAPLHAAVPHPFVINIEDCLNNPPNYMPCQRCTQACEDNAIYFNIPMEKKHTVAISSVIVAIGAQSTGTTALKDVGFGSHPDILTDLELTCFMSNTGPTGGFLEKPSTGNEPEGVVIAMTSQSRMAWHHAAYKAAWLVEEEIEGVTVLYNDTSAYGKDFETFWRDTVGDSVKMIQGSLQRVDSKADNSLEAIYSTSESDDAITLTCEMVILATDQCPPQELKNLAKTLDINLEKSGYISIPNGQAASTSREGVYAIGSATGPMTTKSALAGAAGLASRNAVVHGKKDSEQQVQAKINAEVEERFAQLIDTLANMGARG
jgi:heterodisulfide reductase subunit A